MKLINLNGANSYWSSMFEDKVTYNQIILKKNEKKMPFTFC